MILAVCADNAFGMSFMGRRQSKDAALCRRLAELSGGRLRMRDYSAKQFECPVYAGDDYLTGAETGDWCFVEKAEDLDSVGTPEQIVLFRWNRDYPADRYFKFPGQWRLVSAEDFPGTSHDTITQEVYEQ